MGRLRTSTRSIIQIPSPGFHNRGPLVSLNGEFVSHSNTRDRLAWTCSRRILNTTTGQPNSTEENQLPKGSAPACPCVEAKAVLVCDLRKGRFAF